MQTNYITDDLALLLSLLLSFFLLLVSLEGEFPSQVHCHLQTGSQVSLGSPAACLSTSPPHQPRSRATPIRTTQQCDT